MTREQIEEGKRYLSIIGQLEDAVERFNLVQGNGVSIHLPKDEDVLNAVKELLIDKLNYYKEKFKKL